MDWYLGKHWGFSIWGIRCLVLNHIALRLLNHARIEAPHEWDFPERSVQAALLNIVALAHSPSAIALANAEYIESFYFIHLFGW
jgi:hypothetical protein